MADDFLFESGALRLVADPQGARTGVLWRDGEPLLKLLLWPTWANPAPMTLARCAIGSMIPVPPTLKTREVEGVRGGIYNPAPDIITLFPGELMEHERAGVILHELAHATGHRSRLARENFANVEPDSRELSSEEIVSMFAQKYSNETPSQRHEEMVASLAGGVLAVALGIIPTGSAHWSGWTKRAAVLAEQELKAAINDSLRAAAFILHGDPDANLDAVEIGPEGPQRSLGKMTAQLRRN